MKKFILISLLFSIMTCLFAQQETVKIPYKNSITLSPFSFANKTLSLNYERCFGNSVGIQLTGGIYYYEKNYTNIGYLGEMQFRYYFQSKPYKDNVWNRFFFAPYAFDRQYQISDYPYYDQNTIPPFTLSKKDYSITSYGGGAVIGYKLGIKKFTMEIFLGGGIKLGTSNMEDNIENNFQDDIFDPAYRGITTKGGFNLGFSF